MNINLININFMSFLFNLIPIISKNIINFYHRILNISFPKTIQIKASTSTYTRTLNIIII